MVRSNSSTIPIKLLKLKLLFIGIFLLSLSADGQSCIILVKPAAGKSLPGTLYLAGNFNGWQPADSNLRFTGGTLALAKSLGSIEAKLTGGSWQLAEANKQGKPRPNRIIDLSAQDTLQIIWQGWESHKEELPNNVYRVPTDSLPPFRGEHRPVWVYLPSNYHESKEAYPTLYLQDGQNLFLGLNGSPEKWQVARCLDSLKLKLIVVGIAHGGESRIFDYSLSPRAEYGGGGGEAYLQYLVDSLMPFIRAHYRSSTERSKTWIGGSSLGALISFSALGRYPESFGGALLFSPSYWFNPELASELLPTLKKHNFYTYQIAGDSEGQDPQEMIRDLEGVQNLWLSIAPAKRHRSRIVAGGKHNEQLWQKEFPEAITWLYQASRQ